MSAFLLFTLSVRKDKPLEKYLSWLPNAKVISMLTEMKNAQNKTYPKRIDFVESALSALDSLNITELMVKHALKDGDVEFSHDLSKPRANPKQYYVLIEINDIEYFIVAKSYLSTTEIFILGKVEED
tara:strand:- start:5695 stop:6075 length:381 start_codon:yes stop_codon:yes gene_type:complete